MHTNTHNKQKLLGDIDFSRSFYFIDSSLLPLVIHCVTAFFVRSDRPWRQHRRSANHGRPRRRVTPVVSVSTTPATDGQIFTDFEGREDAGTRVRQQPS